MKTGYASSFPIFILLSTVINELLENDALDFQEDVAKMFEAAEMYPEVGKKHKLY